MDIFSLSSIFFVSSGSSLNPVVFRPPDSVMASSSLHRTVHTVAYLGLQKGVPLPSSPLLFLMSYHISPSLYLRSRPFVFSWASGEAL